MLLQNTQKCIIILSFTVELLAIKIFLDPGAIFIPVQSEMQNLRNRPELFCNFIESPCAANRYATEEI